MLKKTIVSYFNRLLLMYVLCNDNEMKSYRNKTINNYGPHINKMHVLYFILKIKCFGGASSLM